MQTLGRNPKSARFQISRISNFQPHRYVWSYEFLPISAAASIYLFKPPYAILHRVSPEFNGSRNCPPIAFAADSGIGRLVLKVVPVTGAAFTGQHGPINVRPSFPTPTINIGMRVFSFHSFWTSSSLDVPAGVTQEEGHTGFLIPPPFCGACLNFSREKDSATPFPRRL